MPNQWKEAKVLEADFQGKNWVKSVGSKIDGRKGKLKIKIYTHITGCGFEVYMQKTDDSI